MSADILKNICFGNCIRLPTHLADDLVLDDDAVRAVLFPLDLELESGHEVVQQVAHFEGGKLHQFVDAVVLWKLEATGHFLSHHLKREKTCIISINGGKKHK